MTRHSRSARLTAAALALWMTALAAIPASAAIPDGVTPTYDEAYYATLDYYGSLLEGSMVKSYTLNGAQSLTDYGVYDQVVNLTDATPAVTNEGTTAFQFDQAPSHFYFEGKTAKPFHNLPWTISLRYTLNGVPARAEELAGKTGVVEIIMDVVPNEGASNYARYNYTLAATAIFNQDDILSLEAPGAQVQLVGNLRTVLFLCMPGEEQHFTIRVGSDGFSFGGMTVLMVPATLAQLEEIAELSQRRDDLEEDYRALSGSLDSLLDALSDIQGGLYASAKGLDQLDTARAAISGGKGTIYTGAGVLREDLSNIAGLLDPVAERAQALSQTITESKTVLGEMTDTAVSLNAQLDDMEKALKELEDGTKDVKHLMQSAADLEDSLKRLKRALDRAKAPSVGSSSGGMLEQVIAVHSAYTESSRQAFMEKMLTLQGKTREEIAQLKQLQSMSQEEIMTAVQAGQLDLQTVQEAQAGAELLNQLFEAKQNMTFEAFCAELSKYTDQFTAEQAPMMNELWLVYSQVGGIQDDLSSTLDSVTRPTADVVGELAGLCEELAGLTGLLDDAKDLSAALRDAIPKLNRILDSADRLRTALNAYEPTLQESLANVGQMSTAAAGALQDMEQLLADTEALMKTSGDQLDAGTRQSLKGLSAALRQTARALAATGDVRDAKSTITDIIEDTWDEYTGDVNNILLMDAEAEAVSLTDSRNPAPSSVQVLLRTQEIKAEEKETQAAPVSVRETTTFWGRIAQMFRDLWNAITGIFH